MSVKNSKIKYKLWEKELVKHCRKVLDKIV